MLPDQISFNEDDKTIVIVIELVYPKVFHLITPFMDLGTRIGWASLPLLRVAKVSFSVSLNDNGEKAKSLNPKSLWGLYRVPCRLKWLEPKLGLGHLI